MRVLLVDDEPLAIDRLRRFCMRLDDVTVVGEAGDGHEAVGKIAELSPDLVLMDIRMPGRTGVSVAASLVGGPAPEVVFVTAHAEFAANAFELGAADYLLKPVRQDRLQEAVSRARRRRHLNRTYDRLEALEALETERAAAAGARQDDDYATELWIRERGAQVRCAVRDIQRIEANRDYVLIHTPLKTFILRTTMAELEHKLDPRELIRVHRGAFVRLSTVERVEGDRRRPQRLRTRDGAVIEVGASYTRRTAIAFGWQTG